MRTYRKSNGDPQAGQAVFRKVCGQCHKIYGEGQEVGPDITLNGRSSFEQLLSNVFDPSLVIGAAYQPDGSYEEGRRCRGPGGRGQRPTCCAQVARREAETFALDIEELKSSQLSLMPEDLEKTLKPQEIADLFALSRSTNHPPTPATASCPESATSRPAR